jgi:hypothetical protein
MNRLLVLVICLCFAFSGSAQADSYSDTVEIFRKSPQVQPFFDDGYGYAVFPNVGKGGIGIGGAYGEGRVYKGGQATGEATTGQAKTGPVESAYSGEVLLKALTQTPDFRPTISMGPHWGRQSMFMINSSESHRF